MKKIRIPKHHVFIIVTMALLFLLTGAVQSVKGQSWKLTAVPFTDVEIADEFWSPRIETNRKVTIPYAFKKCEETGRIDNFAKAAGLMEGKFEGKYFNDSDVYKVIEGAAYSLKTHPDPQLEKYVDSVIDKIAAAQWEDGYLYTFYSVPQRQPEKRWTNIKVRHELYCAGHFFEAAVAYYQATGKRKILDVAVRFADHIDSVFGPDRRHDPPGHEEIEIGLVKLYRQTGNKKYLKLAEFFIDQRGYPRGRELYGPYSQDHKPVVEQDEAVGHAVRATYLYSGITDVAALTGNDDYVKAVDRIWENVVSKKLYITGGVGARHKGEAFGDNYELPNKTAYNETCAAIGKALWNHRLFLLHGDAKYIDVLERVIYNGFLSGISMTGDRFFYPNPLASDGKERSPWFGCACCPVNVVRFIPSIPGYAYAKRNDSIYVNLFIGSSAKLKLKNNTVLLKQKTKYPWDGNVEITVEPQRSTEFTVNIRIPGWAQDRPVPSDLYQYMKTSSESAELSVNGKTMPMDMDKGFARIKRTWKSGDIIELNLPMPVRRVICNEKVKENVDKVALERGPIVYCAESADNGPNVHRLVLPTDLPLKTEFREHLLGGVYVIRTRIRTWHLEDEDVFPNKQEFVAIPYYAWAHRGAGKMAVWLRRRIDFP